MLTRSIDLLKTGIVTVVTRPKRYKKQRIFVLTLSEISSNLSWKHKLQFQETTKNIAI